MLRELVVFLYLVVAVWIVVYLEIQNTRERAQQGLSHYSRAAWRETRFAYLLAVVWPLVLIIALVGLSAGVLFRRRRIRGPKS